MAVDPVWLPRACDRILAANISLILQSVARLSHSRLVKADHDLRPAARSGFLKTFLQSAVFGGVDRLRMRLAGQRPFYWQVGYRPYQVGSGAKTAHLDGEPFTILADDGARFYADPFLVERNDETFLFVEEYPYASGKGIIAVARLDASGRFSTPVPVLEEPHHLSYPQVFFDEDVAYMIPESAAARQVVLYRSQNFPGDWLPDTVLIDGYELNDATLFRQAGRFWLIATETVAPGSPSDTMVIFSAAALRGPYQPHKLNPILVDCTAARPAGPAILDGDRLFLAFQNGSLRYGGGLGLSELSHLSLEDVEFGPVRPLVPGSAWKGRQIHTLSRTRSYEAVDSSP
jgi:hypothetical protein